MESCEFQNEEQKAQGREPIVRASLKALCSQEVGLWHWECAHLFSLERLAQRAKPSDVSEITAR